MEKEVKTYQIDSWEKLLNLANEENLERILVDFTKWLSFYVSFIGEVRKKNPEETKNKNNYEISKCTFIWIDDGKNDLIGVEITNKKTGETTRINF